MSAAWNRTDFNRLATLFTTGFSGYRPEVREAPNGDTKACANCDGGTRRSGHPVGAPSCSSCHGSGRVPNGDAEGICSCCNGMREVPNGTDRMACGMCHGSGRAPAKRWLHVADKYKDAPEWAREYHDRAYAQACRVAGALGVPAAYYPRPSVGALRVVDYPPGAGTVEHTDWDLFTIVLWRSTPLDLERTAHPTSTHALDASSRGLHIGEIGELVGLGPATPHRVPARPYAQQELTYYAVPDHAATLPRREQRGRKFTHADGPTVGQWLAEREARSRIASGGYE